MYEQKLKDWIKPVKTKLHIEKWLNISFKIVLIASIIMLAISALSIFIPIAFLWKKLMLVFLLAILAALGAAIMVTPDIKQVLKRIDSLGYKERFITAWELREEETEEAQLQRTELEQFLKESKPDKLFKYRLIIKPFNLGVLIIILAVVLSFLPTPAREQAAELESLQKQFSKEAKKLEEEKERLYKEYQIPKEKQAELDKQLKELEKQLKNAKTEEEALKKLAIAKNELKKLDPKELSADLKKLGEKMTTQGLKELSEALKKEDLEAIKKLLSKIEKKEDIESLKNAAKAIDNEELKKLLEELAKALENKSEEEIAQMAENINNMLESSMGNAALAGKMSSLSQGMKSAINSMAQSLSLNSSISELAFSDQEQNGQQGEGEGQGQGQGEGEGEGQGQGEGEGEGEGQGQGQGEGQGQGQGQQGQGGGSGAGEGSTNNDSGYSNESGTTSHNNNGNGKVSEYEALYQPYRIGGSSESSFVKGKKGTGGQSSFQEKTGGTIDKGKLVNYTEVSADYKSQASQSMEDMNIPSVMKELIRDYFTSIE